MVSYIVCDKRNIYSPAPGSISDHLKDGLYVSAKFTLCAWTAIAINSLSLTVYKTAYNWIFRSRLFRT